jgi:thiol:disulfide interchange protein
MNPPRLLAIHPVLAALLAAMLAFFAPATAMAQDEVVVSVKAQKQAVVPGETLAIAVVFDHEDGWHIHPNKPVVPPEMGDFTPIATTITPQVPDTVELWPVQWPKAKAFPVNFGDEPAMYEVYGGRAIAYLPIRIAESATPGSEITISLRLVYQACDDINCLMPEDTTRPIRLRVISLEEAAALPVVPVDPDFLGFDPAVFATAPGGEAAASVNKPVAFSVFGWNFSIDAAGAGFVLLLTVAALGGFLLNLTPCVLPVIPLKIMGLSQAAGHPARCFLLGAVMSAGVIVFWIAIGGAIAFISGFSAISSLFQTAWFAIAVGAFILVMGIGMLGAFVVQLPRAVYMVNPSHETVPGSFLFGIMTAILSTPCTAPFMGSAAAWAATQNPAITLATFGAIGGGMALPYLVLSAFPKLVGRIPRTGPASELIKQTMGLLLIAVAIFFLGTGLDPLIRQPVDPPFRFFWWVIAAIATVAMLWLVFRAWQITRRPVLRVFWSGFAMVFTAGSIFVAAHVADRGPIAWIGYTPERLADYQARGKVVVLDFTAEWCLNCKALEAGVLHRPEIVRLLSHPDVIPLKVDLTGNNVPGRLKLQELQWVGIPLLAIYGPGVDEPIKYDAYTPEIVREAILRAGGPQLAQRLASMGGVLPTAAPADPPTR